MFRKSLVLLLALAAWAAAGDVPGRYIVELEDEGGRSAQRLARVRTRQADARKRLKKARILGTVEQVGNNLLVATDDPAELSQLPGVRRVHQVRTLKMYLDRAVALQKIDEAWRQVGEDRAGAGVKVAVIDSGVDQSHPGLAANGLTAPAGFPRFNLADDEANTTGKVIVARSYVNMLSGRDPDLSARDRVGHGTALAMIIAGGRATGPLATIAGIAPRAQIGNYKVFGSPGYNDDTSDDVLLKAIDDAVADGMDIINLSLGSDVASRLEDDVLAQAVERATKAGVIVVCAAGNNGPDFGTIGSPATAPSAIAVGATRNSRTLGTVVAVDGLEPIQAINGDGPTPADPLKAPGVDIQSFDETRLGCGTYPAGSLRGRVAVIMRGTCTFNLKITNAQTAGAVGVLVYAPPGNPDAIVMGVAGATLPAMMINAADGERLRARLAEVANAAITLNFLAVPVEQEANRLTDFSSIGPAPDLSLKPELSAIGGDVYTATQRLDPGGDMYTADGFILIDGTSFSAPMVAGAAALLKAARPGLTVEQYRSLLINNASPANDVGGGTVAIAQKAGAGQLDLGASVRSTIAASPALVSFGAGTADPRLKATVRLSNLGGTAETYSFQLVPQGDSAGPVLPASAAADANGFTLLELVFESSGLRAGAHEGRIRVIASSGAAIEIPYWYAVASQEASSFPLIAVETQGRRGALVRNAILFRVADAAGVAITGTRPELSVREGDGTVTLVDYDRDSPGLWGVTVRLGAVAGPNVIRLQFGDKFRDVTIAGQ